MLSRMNPTCPGCENKGMDKHEGSTVIDQQNSNFAVV